MPSTTRRCPRCMVTFPRIPEYFYVRGNGQYEYCTARHANGCHEAYWANRRQMRREGVTASTEARFGVEIEFEGNSTDVCHAMRNAGLRCNIESYNHLTRRYWKIVTDASVRSGAELVSPPLSGADGMRQLQAVCAALGAAGARPNLTTGLHVHHEMRGHTSESFSRAIRFWFNNQTLIAQLVSPSRRNGQWCHDLTRSEVEHICQTITQYGLSTMRHAQFRVDRYKSLNVTSFPRYGTIELRQHQGTVNFRKMSAWVEFGRAVFAFAKTDVDVAAYATINDLLDALVEHGGLSNETGEYLKGRAIVLATRTHRETPVEPISRDVDDEERCACGEVLDDQDRCPATVRTIRPQYAVAT